MNVFHFDCYRNIIAKQIKSQSLSQRHLAQVTGIHTSYFSRVMQQGADFSEEQLYSISKQLGFSDTELEYMNLLLSHSRSGNRRHKKFLFDKIQKLRDENTKIVDELKEVHADLSEEDVATYYEEAITAKIHMLLTIGKFRYHRDLLEKELGISSRKLAIELQKLQRLKIIDVKEDRIEILKKSIHLDHSHPSSVKNHRNWRIETLHRLGAYEGRQSDYHLSAIFSCNEETKLKIRRY